MEEAEGQGQAAEGGEVGTAVAVLLAARALVERDVEYPMRAVFDRPVFADGVRQRLGLGGGRRMSRRDSPPSSPAPSRRETMTARVRRPGQSARHRHRRG